MLLSPVVVLGMTWMTWILWRSGNTKEFGSGDLGLDIRWSILFSLIPSEFPPPSPSGYYALENRPDCCQGQKKLGERKRG